ncbi:valine--tRNA ligase [Candidatus Saccharibacteria bacterium]|nr:valine--tRNA ligase [Candidatus Saccharibacteria bacterium]
MKLPKVYEPHEYENDIYELWEKAEIFKPKNRGSDNSYSIVVPPPNANGNLHLGHGLNHTIMDIAVRYHRMKGEASLLLPGADHAGFETQVVYEKKLAEQGKSRFDFNREELYSQIWDFVAENRDNYETQFRKLGDSVDWSRYVFTLDEKIIKRTYETFKKMWDEGLVYRGERLVNFCTHHGTGFADIEVAYKDVPGHIWSIKYPLTDGSGNLTVATTRPETMLGDTAVAVNPKDKRYKNYVGKTIKLPLTNREIPIIADGFVDVEFGTGAVKITPAHDPNDYDAALRHDLPMISVIDHEGKMTHQTPEKYRGLTVADARKAVVDDLKEQGLLEEVKDHPHSVGHCYKCGTVIEPLLREQWFITMKPLATRAIKVLRDDKIKFYPSSKKKQLIEYLEGLKDWNISRQIAWGIPIPAFQSQEDPEHWIFDTRVDQEIIVVDGKKYVRDPDVFDTWFSSSSWPYSTLDYPDGEDFKKFYPLSLMETGADILFPWVSRMIMLGLYVTDTIPFEAVYLHGLVQDEHGAKMSKSKGNVIDPMEKIQEFGTDAFRMGMIANETAGNNRPFDPSKLVGARNFCNKLWNIARFIEDKVGDKSHLRVSPKAETIADHWVLSKLQHSIEKTSFYLENNKFNEAYDTVYHTVWDDVADWYIEASKGSANSSILGYILETILKLAHPFAPFVTETIWQTFKWEDDSILAISEWPSAPKYNKAAVENFEIIKSIVTEIRYIRSEMHLKGEINLYHGGEKFLNEHGSLICAMAKVSNVKEVEAGRGLHLTSTKLKCWLDVDQETIQNFLVKLEQKQSEQKQIIKQLESRLENKSYIKKAPKKLVDETKSQLEEAKAFLAKLAEESKRFGKTNT